MGPDDLGEMQVLCDGVPVCEFNQQDQPELSADETDMPRLAGLYQQFFRCRGRTCGA